MTRHPLRRNPVRLLFSNPPWAAALSLFVYLFTGTFLFAVVLSAVVTAGVLGFTLAGLPLLIAAAAVVRWSADVERFRLRPLAGEPIKGGYRAFTGSGVFARIRHLWSDPQLWRDIAYLVALFAALLTLDMTVLAVWLTLLAGITLPAWYRFPVQEWAPGATAHGVQLGYFPNGPHGHPGYGFYVDTLPKSLLAAAVFLVLFLLFNYVLIATARLHTGIARALLGAQEDPLREAKEVLRRPGPLSEQAQSRAPVSERPSV